MYAYAWKLYQSYLEVIPKLPGNHRPVNHSAMSLLRATVLLFLLTSAVLAWTLALADNVPSTIDEMIDESYSDDTINGDSRINQMFNEASAKPSCPTDYTK